MGCFGGFGNPSDERWTSGNPPLRSECFTSGGSVNSIISIACPWGRRYQVIFRNRQFFDNRAVGTCDRIFLSDRGCGGSRYGDSEKVQGEKSTVYVY